MRWMLILCCVMLCTACQTTKKPQSNIQELQHVLGEVKKSFNMKDAVAKYCPVCGKHYSGHLEKCPVDNTKLLPVE